MINNKSRYFLLQLRIFLNIFSKGKISFKKIINAAYCFIAYFLKLPRSAKYPFMINFELWNECNSNCVFCRTVDGQIYNQNPRSVVPIAKGKMPLEIYEGIIRQVKDYILMAVLYINGEPLIYPDIFKAIKFASDNKVPTLIATNGILLNEGNARKLLSSGLDFIKIAVSGFTQGTYKMQHRFGDIEKIKSNLESISKINIAGNYNCLIVLDYIYYYYNKHELNLFRSFCKKHGIIFNVRMGNLNGMEDKKPELSKESNSSVDSNMCDWIWKVLSVDWNGDIFPCCDFVVWGGAKSYATYISGSTDLAKVWNSTEAQSFRKIHAKQGKKVLDICARCLRHGTAFKY